MNVAGGGAGRILINPADLRRGSKRLRDLSADLNLAGVRLRSAPSPATAPEVAGVPEAVRQVGTQLDQLVEPLTDSAVELDRRALWAEIADQLIAGVPLTSAQLAEFMAGLRDGTLVKYAQPWQANLAGEWLGGQYRSNFTDPQKLRELVTLLKANGGMYTEQHGAFFAGFIDRFGPDNIAHISRVIQAMEWPGLWQMAGSTYSDHYFDDKLMRKYFDEGYRLDDKSAVDFLLTFGMALSVATYTGQLSRWSPGAERRIAFDPDTWGVAQLLNHDGPFGATFLRDVFHNGVLAEIGRNAGVAGGVPTSYAPIGGNDYGLPTDRARIILDALARNPHGAALALSDPLPAELQVSYLLEGNSNPIAILYDHMDWDDDGEEFASLYKAGVDWCYQNGQELRAFGMTQSLLDRTLNSDWRDYDVMTTALANDLAQHHIADLHISSTGGYPDGPPGDYKVGFAGLIYVDQVLGEHLIIQKDDLESLFRHLSDHPEAEAAVLDAARDYQRTVLLENTKVSSSDPEVSLEWAKELGSFNGILMNAHGMELAEDFDADSFKHQMVFKFFDSVVGATPAKPVYGAGASFFLSAIDDATKPSFAAVVDSAAAQKEALQRAMHAAIVSGYYENGTLGPTGKPPDTILVDGHLVPFLELKDPDKIRQFLIWVETDDRVDVVAGEAIDRADQARDNRAAPSIAP